MQAAKQSSLKSNCLFVCYSTCTERSAYTLLEWLQMKRTPFPLPGSLLVPPGPEFRCGKEGCFHPESMEFTLIGHCLASAHTNPSNNAWASTRTIHELAAQSSDLRRALGQSTDWLRKARIRGEHGTIGKSSQSKLCS